MITLLLCVVLACLIMGGALVVFAALPLLDVLIGAGAIIIICAAIKAIVNLFKS